MSKTGISTACFYPGDTYDSLRQVLSTDTEIAELFMNALCEAEPAELKKLKDCLDASGKRLISFHPYTSAFESLLFFSEYGPRRQDGIDLYRRFFEAAAYLGATHVVFHGEKEIPTFSRGLASDEILCEAYGLLIGEAKKYGLVFTQENVSKFRSQTPAHIAHLRKLIPDLRFTFDLKQALRSHQDENDMVRAMGEALVHIHINDYGEECCLPFRGSTDMARLRDTLRGIGYRGDYIVEVYRKNFTDLSELSAACREVNDFFCAPESHESIINGR